MLARCAVAGSCNPETPTFTADAQEFRSKLLANKGQQGLKFGTQPPVGLQHPVPLLQERVKPIRSSDDN